MIIGLVMLLMHRSQPDYDIYDNTGKCDVYNVTGALGCNSTNRTFDVVVSGECLYPFETCPTKYERHYLKSFGMEHCALPCDFEFYKGNIEALV